MHGIKRPYPSAAHLPDRECEEGNSRQGNGSLDPVWMVVHNRAGFVRNGRECGQGADHGSKAFHI